MILAGNILWFILGGGIFACIGWALLGLVLCVTGVGIPFGVAAMRIGGWLCLGAWGRRLCDAPSREHGLTSINAVVD